MSTFSESTTSLVNGEILHDYEHSKDWIIQAAVHFIHMFSVGEDYGEIIYLDDCNQRKYIPKEEDPFTINNGLLWVEQNIETPQCLRILSMHDNEEKGLITLYMVEISRESGIAKIDITVQYMGQNILPSTSDNNFLANLAQFVPCQVKQIASLIKERIKLLHQCLEGIATDKKVATEDSNFMIFEPPSLDAVNFLLQKKPDRYQPHKRFPPLYYTLMKEKTLTSYYNVLFNWVVYLGAPKDSLDLPVHQVIKDLALEWLVFNHHLERVT